MKRRKFIGSAVSFSVLIAFHQEAQALAQLRQPAAPIGTSESRFPKITLYTSDLEAQFSFYKEVLGFPVIERTPSQFSMQIGDSVLRFKELKDGTEPFYHYAINIPSNKYIQAKDWLSKRTPLLSNNGSGDDLLYFDFWDAHAMYFKDPSGNIGELIARHTLSNDREGDFGISDLLCISEIGTPVENPSDFAAELKSTFDLDIYGSSMFIGDENGLFVAVPIDRTWIPENTQKAAVHPTDIWLSEKGSSEFQYQNYPYKIY